MEFSVASAIAESWANSNKLKFSLIFADAQERKLHFAVNDIAFYVICPAEENETWNVWSDAEVVICCLSEIHNFAEACTGMDLEPLLDKISGCLSVLLGEDISTEAGDDDDDDGDYYNMTEEDLEESCVQQEEEAIGASNEEESLGFVTTGNTLAVSRLLADLKRMKASSDKFGISAQPRNDNLFVWDVKLLNIDQSSRLGQDLARYATSYQCDAAILMEMQFPDDYPMAPPFVRILRPRFKFLTGHVTIGGSVCSELLTRSGWVPTNDVESILVQIRAEILSDEQAQLDSNPDIGYTEHEAKIAFERMVAKYGWQ